MPTSSPRNLLPIVAAYLPVPIIGAVLTGIFGRKAGTREGFAGYSKVLKDSGFVWTPELLDAWLASPGEFLADSTMIFVGIPDRQARADLIAYLQQFD